MTLCSDLRVWAAAVILTAPAIFRRSCFQQSGLSSRKLHQSPQQLLVKNNRTGQSLVFSSITPAIRLFQYEVIMLETLFNPNVDVNWETNQWRERPELELMLDAHGSHIDLNLSCVGWVFLDLSMSFKAQVNLGFRLWIFHQSQK